MNEDCDWFVHITSHFLSFERKEIFSGIFYFVLNISSSISSFLTNYPSDIRMNTLVYPSRISFQTCPTIDPRILYFEQIFSCSFYPL